MKWYALVLSVFCSLAQAEPATTAESGQSVIRPTVLEGLPIKMNALLQAWTLEDTSAVVGPHANFRLRRAELRFSGSPVVNTRYFLMLDPAKSINTTAGADGKILQDLGVGFTVVEGLEVVAGQFKTLTTADGLESSSSLLLPERSVVGRTYGDRREPGLMLTYSRQDFKVGAMVSNGQGPNADSTADTKDLSVRTDITLAPGVAVGAFGLFGDFEYNKKGRWGVNTRLAPMDSATAGLEFAMGRTNGVNSYGLVGDVGYNVTTELQPVVRYEVLRTDTIVSTVSQQISLGVNYNLLRNTARIQTAYSYLQNLAGNNGTPRVANGSFGHLVTLAFQMAI